MTYEPLAGWVQVTQLVPTGAIRSQRFHGDYECARRGVRKAIERGLSRGVPVVSYLSDRMTYAHAHRLQNLTTCKCAGGRGRHATGPDRRFGEVQAGSQGTGRRR